jgi:transcriptional regulator with XRE-family HTH domain
MKTKTGEIIRQKRIEKDLTQVELAKLSGVSQQRIQAVENGKHNLSFTATEKLLAVMGYEIKITENELKQ